MIFKAVVHHSHCVDEFASQALNQIITCGILAVAEVEEG